MRIGRLCGLRAALMRTHRTPVRCNGTSSSSPSQGPKIDPNEFTGPAQHHHTPKQAYLFGREPGAKKEGWERITMLVWVGAAAILAIGMSTRSGESLQDWARREAMAREKRVEEGKEVQYGTHYSNNEGSFVHDEPDKVPQIAADED